MAEAEQSLKKLRPEAADSELMKYPSCNAVCAVLLHLQTSQILILHLTMNHPLYGLIDLE